MLLPCWGACMHVGGVWLCVCIYIYIYIYMYTWCTPIPWGLYTYRCIQAHASTSEASSLVQLLLTLFINSFVLLDVPSRAWKMRSATPRLPATCSYESEFILTTPVAVAAGVVMVVVVAVRCGGNCCNSSKCIHNMCSNESFSSFTHDMPYMLTALTQMCPCNPSFRV